MIEGMTRIPASACLLLLGLLTACGDDAPRHKKDAVRSPYVAGQVWKYETRDGEESSRVHVVRVEKHPAWGVMVHVYIDGLKIPNPGAQDDKDKLIRIVSHMPLTEKAMDDSVTRMLEKNQPIPHYEAGYRAWHKAFMKGDATVFETPIKTMLQQYADGIASARRKDAQGGS